MTLPADFLAHLQELGYNSRSNKHSNALADAVLSDLVSHCPAIRDRARTGSIVYSINFDIGAGTSSANVDLVIGAAPPGTPAPDDQRIRRTAPAMVQIAIELKAVMTEHRKQVLTRKRDFEAHHEHVHNYSRHAIAGGVLVVNIASRYQSTLRGDESEHRNISRNVEHCITQMRNVSYRSASTDVGLDAKAVIVVDMDNIDWPSTTYREAPPAPQVGDQIHYDSFIQRVCHEYTDRFGD